MEIASTVLPFLPVTVVALSIEFIIASSVASTVAKKRRDMALLLSSCRSRTEERSVVMFLTWELAEKQ